MIGQSQKSILRRSSSDALSPVATAMPVFDSAENFIDLIVGEIESAADWRWHVQPSAGVHQPWIRVIRPDVKLPRQGWKLHVTATVLDAPEILQHSLSVLLMSACCFKVAGSVALLDHLNQGVGGATQVGKFITVYPFDESAAVRLGEALDAATRDRGLHGPAVPSDRPIAPGSLVSYRFGAFGEDLMQTPIGELVPGLLAPDGQWVPDRRTVGFNPPEWAEDPFIAAGVVRHTSSQEHVRLLADRYLPLATLYSSPRGDVFLATDLVDGRVCVLKSAHPYAAIGRDGRDARDRLRYEADVLAQLAPLAPVPTPLSLVEDDGELYLALEYVGGETLETRVLALTTQGRLPEPAQVLAWGQQLADVLTTVHDAGFVYGDLKSINVLERPDGGLCLVDVEAAQQVGGAQAASCSGTRGYLSPERGVHGSPTVDDDVHGLGALLYFLATGAEPSLAARPEQLLSRPVELLNPSTAPPFVQIISRCLAPVSDADRFHTPA
jgi:Protein kinase domain